LYREALLLKNRYIYNRLNLNPMATYITPLNLTYDQPMPAFFMFREIIYTVVRLKTYKRLTAPTLFEFLVKDVNGNVLSKEYITMVLNETTHEYEDHYFGFQYDGSKEFLIITPITTGSATDVSIGFELEYAKIADVNDPDGNGGLHSPTSQRPITPKVPQLEMY
jgi:hypothetical protein